MINYTNPERAKEIIKEVNALRKELFELTPQFEVKFEPRSYDSNDGDFVLVMKEPCVEWDENHSFYIDQNYIRRFKTREEGTEYIDFYKKEMGIE